MPPIASTSQATPSSIADSTPARSRLSRKGKEKAVYTPPAYEFDDLSHGTYQPRSGQLQRKKPSARGGGRGGSKLAERGSSSTRGKRRKSTTEGGLGVETIRVGATIEKNQEEEGIGKPPKKRKRKNSTKLDSSTSKRKSKARFDDTPDPSSQPDLLSPSASTARQTKKGSLSQKNGKGKSPLVPRQKKSVRLDLPPLSSTSSSSDNDNDFAPSGGRDDDVSRPDSDSDAPIPPISRTRRLRSSGPIEESSLNDVLLDDDDETDRGSTGLREREESLDYSNPHNLPRQTHAHQRRRTSKKYWRNLEFGVYRSAVVDTVKEENGLDGLLLGWDKLVKRQRKLEEREKAVAEGDDEAEEEGEEGKKGKGRPTKRKVEKNEQEDSPAPTPGRKKTGRPLRQHRIALISTPKGTPVENGDEDDSDAEPKFPLPSAETLSQMARWPLYPVQLLNFAAQSGQRIDLQEELQVLAEQTRRETVSLPERQLRIPRRKIPSAYSAGGPLSNRSSPTSDDSEPDFDSDSSTSSIDLPSPPPFYPPSFLSIPNTINSVLTRLSDFVPKEPLPALDIWSVKAREAELKKERERATEKGEKEKERSVPGWREVVAVARENEGIPKHVVDQLEQQLKELYGVPPSTESEGEGQQPEPVVLPPVGGEPPFLDIKPKERKKRVYKPRKQVEAERKARRERAAALEKEAEGQQEGETSRNTNGSQQVEAVEGGAGRGGAVVNDGREEGTDVAMQVD
ncbi:uncharacterized protein JCM6883_007301 [Sporobolomyces salmoneus]|uniref:uncharacterized protein n=1 Tax=Sporobolomyces salmoneus TaxID=183962 RepID=UPI00318162C7